ncbi:MAG: hypothetical protein IPQ01_19155 [Zoogloea sp.]|nr:hypothetical protein [Zoogloea sp.]
MPNRELWTSPKNRNNPGGQMMDRENLKNLAIALEKEMKNCAENSLEVARLSEYQPLARAIERAKKWKSRNLKGCLESHGGCRRPIFALSEAWNLPLTIFAGSWKAWINNILMRKGKRIGPETRNTVHSR